VRAGWNKAYEAELVALPAGKHDDQADAAASAYNLLDSKGAAPRISFL
jgi:phage terminase large subunit-like protein